MGHAYKVQLAREIEARRWKRLQPQVLTLQPYAPRLQPCAPRLQPYVPKLQPCVSQVLLDPEKRQAYNDVISLLWEISEDRPERRPSAPSM